MPNLITWHSLFGRAGHAGLARHAPQALPASSARQIFIQYRSTIYAAAAPLIPAAAAWLSRPASLVVLCLALIFSLAAAGFLPRLARWSAKFEDMVNLKLGRVTPARLLRPIFQP